VLFRSFSPTISISLLLLAAVFLPLNETIAHPLWVVGASLHLLFTLYVINKWMHHEHFQIQHSNPAWFIPAVGNMLVPVAGVQLGYVDVSWFFFSIGMLFWVVLMTIVFYRILFHTPIDARLLPTLFILIAPPAVGFISYMRLEGGELDPFARFLYFSGLFLTLLLFSQIRRFVHLQFSLSWWAYSFPTAAITIASFVMHEKSANSVYLWLASGLLVILTCVVGLLLVRTAVEAIMGKICVPGH
jgi:tellurite resistance protein